MNNKRRNPMLPRFLIAAAAGIAVMFCVCTAVLVSADSVAGADTSLAGDAVIRALGEDITGAQNGGDAGEQNAGVTLIYSTAPGDSTIQRSVEADAAMIASAAPGDVDGYHFYWLLDGQRWDGIAADGMTLEGAWIPVYEVTVY